MAEDWRLISGQKKAAIRPPIWRLRNESSFGGMDEKIMRR